MKIKRILAENSKVVVLVISWLLVVNIFALLGLNRLNLKPDNAYVWMNADRFTQDQSWSMEKFHARWDSNYYIDIAKNGYSFTADKPLSNIVFFPMYPLLIKTVSFVFGFDLVLGAWVVSVLALIGGCVYLYKLTREFHPEIDALLLVFLLLIFPTAFFLTAVYTESLFLLFSVASFYFAMKKRYVLAGIFGLAASLTRVTGVLLFLPLLVQVWQNEGLKKKALVRSLPLLLIPLGTFSFFLFHWIRFGDPFLFFKVESAWGRFFSFNGDHFLLYSSAAVVNFSLDVFYALFGIVMVVMLLRRRLFAYALYVGSTLGVAISTGTLMSIGRYLLVLFPMYIIGASLRNDVAKYAWVLVSGLLLALNTILFVNWYWAG